MVTPELGSLVGDKYRIVRTLGTGGMGAVFEAEHVVTGKRCAIKRLHRRPGAGERARAIHEARAACRIHHENVVDVYDVLEQDGAIYLVMELLSGDPLSAVLAREPPAPAALIALLLPAMRGMIAAHEAGVVHRDLKPDNIFLADEPGHRGRVAKVIDFGVSKVADSAPAAADEAGMTLGTPRYMSFEQLIGGAVDARADVYAFGAILYEALTGRAPYGDARSLGDLGLRMATTTPEPPHALRPDLPAALSALVMRAIARDADDRLTSMTELVAGLAPFAASDRDEHETRATVRPLAPRRSLPSRARWKAPSLAALAIAAALTGFALLRSSPGSDLPRVSSAARRAPASSAAQRATERPLAPPPAMEPVGEPVASAQAGPSTADAAAGSGEPPRASALLRAVRRSAARPRPAAARGTRATSSPLRDAGQTVVTSDERHRAGQLQRSEF